MLYLRPKYIGECIGLESDCATTYQIEFSRGLAMDAAIILISKVLMVWIVSSAGLCAKPSRKFGNRLYSWLLIVSLAVRLTDSGNGSGPSCV